MSEVQKLVSKTIDVTKDNYLSLFEAWGLVSSETVGPELDEEETNVLQAAYHKLIEGEMGAEQGVQKVLSDKIEEGKRERKRAARTRYATVGGGLIGLGIGVALALTGPTIPIAMVLVSGAFALMGAGVGNLGSRLQARFFG